MKTTLQIKLEKELFNMVYQWGKIGVQVDYRAPAFQTVLNQLMGKKWNGVHKVGTGYLDCYIENCKKKHLPF